MNSTNWTTEKILEKLMQCVAPLPSQRNYARHLATIFSMHIHRNKLMDDGISADDLPSPSAIVVAPTGQGKTYLIRKMAECVGQKAIIIDCGTLSAEGWKGISLSQRLAAASKDTTPEAFSRSILFFDEADKLKFWGTQNDQGNAMTNLLQLYNNGTLAVEIEKETKHIDVSRFTILLGGAFVGLEDIIRERVCPKTKIGFDTKPYEHLTNAELMRRATHADLVKFGLMPELLGRIGTILTIPPLGIEDYRQLLNAEAGSLRRKYHNYLSELYGVKFEIADSGVEEIAQRCKESETGARAVTPIVNDMMCGAVAAVESEFTINKVILDADEDGCCIRYEHGPRDYSFWHEQTCGTAEILPVYVVKAKNIAALVRKLCRYYRNAEGDLLRLHQLKAFLDCTITYLFLRCRPTEFTFDSLEKFARTTYRPGEDRQSPYDIIMDDAKAIFTNAQLQAFDQAYDRWMAKNLASAMRLIMEYIRKHHGPCHVKFHIPSQRRLE